MYPADLCVDTSSLGPGSTIGPHTLLQKLTQSGSNSSLWLSTDSSGERVVVKYANPDTDDFVREASTNALRREIAVLPLLRDIYHVVQIVGAVTTDPPVLVVEWLLGPSLKELLQQQARVTWDEVQPLMLDVCDGLRAIHERGLVHGDIKPGNVIRIKARHGLPAAVIIDLGLARLVELSPLASDFPLPLDPASTAVPVCTIRYASPEQLQANPLDARSDIYSTGCTLYELLSGRPPFRGTDLAELAHQHCHDQPEHLGEIALLPAELANTVMACLEKDPGNRPETAAKLRSRLT